MFSERLQVSCTFLLHIPNRSRTLVDSQNGVVDQYYDVARSVSACIEDCLCAFLNLLVIDRVTN